MLKLMDKLQYMELQIDELKESKAAEVVSGLRKYNDTQVSTAAKKITSFLERKMRTQRCPGG